jgi:hypothetical protein
MSRLKLLFIALLLLGATGCATPRPSASSKPCPANPDKVLNTTGCTQAAAALGYEYAVLAELAYDPKAKPDRASRKALAEPILAPPPDVVEAEACTELACDGALGYQYRVFHRVRDGRVIEKIIAFRGTDGKGDWSTNILGRKDQNRAALATFLKVRGDGAIPVSVTGHSLGGALATQVSMCNPVHMRVSFDASPRFYQSLCPGGRAIPRPADAGVKLLHFSEYGEFLGPFRLLGRDPDQLTTPVNCERRQNTIGQHSIRQLTECIVDHAILGGSDQARRYKEENLDAFEKYLPARSG